jgi:hypothetical protein
MMNHDLHLHPVAQALNLLTTLLCLLLLLLLPSFCCSQELSDIGARAAAGCMYVDSNSKHAVDGAALDIPITYDIIDACLLQFVL